MENYKNGFQGTSDRYQELWKEMERYEKWVCRKVDSAEKKLRELTTEFIYGIKQNVLLDGDPPNLFLYTSISLARL
jgi:hypothetical protein